MPTRLTSLRIKNYRQLRSLEIAELGQVNLVVGANNSGKSTLLEAIQLLASRGAASVIAEILALHGEYQMTSGGDSTADWQPERAIANLFSGRSFPTSDGEAICVGDLTDSLSLRLEHVFLQEESEEREVEGKKVTLRRAQRASKADIQALSADAFEAIETTMIDGRDTLNLNKKVSIATPLANFFSARHLPARHRVDEIAPQIPTSFVQARFTQRSLAEAWDDVVLTDGESDALAALRLIEPATDGVAFVQQFRPGSVSIRFNNFRPDNLMRMDRSDERFAVIRLKGSPTPVPLQSMGDGMTRVLQLTLAALRARAGFLLIDEMESGLHYSIQEDVWRLIFKLARAGGTQVFATTHSLDCVRAFAKVSAQDELDGKLLHMERNEESGDAEISAVSEDELSHLVAAGIEVR